MKRLIIEILAIIILSTVIGLVYNSVADEPIDLIRKKLDENIVSKEMLFDPKFVSTKKTLDKTVTIDLIKEVIDNPDVFIIDARRPEQYAEGFIGNSVNIYPYTDNMDEKMEAIFNIPTDKAVICYCDGGSCDLSHELAKELLDLGYTKVFIYYGGWEEWTKKQSI